MEDYKKYFIELRKKSIGVLIIFIIGLLGGILFSNKILTFSLKMFNFSGVNVMVTSPTQLIDLSLYTGLICGVLLALPFLTVQLIRFIRPAIKKNEYTLIKKILPLSVILFGVGAVFGAWVTQFVIVFYSKYSAEFQVNNMWDIQKFFFQVVMTAVLMGFIFQMPLILTFLIRIGLVKRDFIASKRRYVYAAIIILAVLLPPTDIVSLLLTVIPLTLLFEIALLLNMSQA